jgi:hypothetical protein
MKYLCYNIISSTLMELLIGRGPNQKFLGRVGREFHNFGESKMQNKSELYDLIFRFAERDHLLAIVFITIIGFGPLALMALKQMDDTRWITSLWFMLSLGWFALVCADLSGFAPWFNYGIDFPQISLR